MKTALIIATYERGHLLERTLQRLHQLTLPDEIHVVDDGGQDDTPFVCTHYGDHLNYWRVPNEGWTTPCMARNLALRGTSCEHIIVTEPEIFFVSDVVRELNELRQRPERTSIDRWICREAVLHESVCQHQESEGGPFKEVPGFYVHSFMADWLREIGGWDEHFPESWGWDDIDLYKRLDYNNHPRFGIPSIKIRHLWHPSRINEAVENEAYARGKVMPQDLIANR